MSSSSWGCELKYIFMVKLSFVCSHPLREDVSWNVSYGRYFLCENCHPLREDVSWNITFRYCICVPLCRHPLREDVSWNRKQRIRSVHWNVVILFVRMWVEMSIAHDLNWLGLPSSSSWGCELKCSLPGTTATVPWSSSSWGCELKFHLASVTPPHLLSSSSWGCELKFSWQSPCSIPAIVILFVRMWVEMVQRQKSQTLCQSSSSWGCELKCHVPNRKTWKHSHPLREDVSWNSLLLILSQNYLRHPLREDVSWNNCWTRRGRSRSWSSSSWGCELK